MVDEIRDVARKVYSLAKEKGWYDDRDTTLRENVAIALINIHGEVSEAWEAYRHGTLFAPCDKSDKLSSLGLPILTSLEEELADIVIRVFDTAEHFKIDIQKAIEVKHAFNATRSFKHGGKLA